MPLKDPKKSPQHLKHACVDTSPSLILKFFKLCIATATFASALLIALVSASADGPAIALSADRVAAGSTLAVTLDSDSRLSELKLRFGDQTGCLFDPPGGPINRKIGMIAVPFKATAGAHALTVNWSKSGHPRQRVVAFAVVSGKYRSETLTVDPGRVNPTRENRQRAARESRQVSVIYATGHPMRRWDVAFQKPLTSAITSPFGIRRLFNGKMASYHSGIDFRAPVGTPVKAANRGTVRLAQNLFYAGNTVLIDHGAGVFTIYAHLSRIAVTVDQALEKGQVIGRSGRSGRVNGPHLHWGVKLNAQTVDPLQFLRIISETFES